MTTVRLLSSDDQEFEVLESVAKMSRKIKHQLEGKFIFVLKLTKHF